MNDSHDGGLIGRITALALILAVAYGVRAINRGGMGCPFGGSSGCCAMPAHSDESSLPPAPDALSGPDAPKNIPAAPAPAPAKK